MSKKKKKNSGILKRIPGILMLIVSVLLEIVFCMALYDSDMLPLKYMLAVGGVFVLLDVAIGILAINTHRTVRFAIGAALTVICWLVCCIGARDVSLGVDTIQDATDVSYEVADVSVIVQTDDAAQSIWDAKDYTFGILQSLDRENTDEAIQTLNKQLGVELNVVEYAGIEGLADALLKTHEIQGIIMNYAYVGLYVDIEDYEKVEEQLRVIDTVEIKHEIEHATASSAGGSNFVGAQDTTPAAANAAADSSENTTETAAAVNQTDETTAADSEEFQDCCFTVYISGIDNRGGLIALSRSDVNIIATINTATKQILLINTPRDFYVPLSISNGECDKLTHAGIYGIDVCMDTMGMLYNTTLDYYFRVNFSGFEDIVDALGGVTVNSEYAFTSKNGNYDFVVGENKVNGAQALAFARERYAFASGDRQRGKNQMALIKAMAKKAMSPVLLTNYSAIINSLDGSFETTMPYSLISGMVKEQLDCGAEWTILSYSVDGVGDSQKPYSLSTKAYVMVPTQSTVDKAIDLMNRVKNGEKLTEADVSTD